MDCKEFIELLESTTKRSHGEIAGRIIIDSKKLKWYPVPSNINHPEFVEKVLLKMSKTEIENNPEKAEHLVGAAVFIEDNSIKSLLTGISGLETWLRTFKKPIHNKKDVTAAHVFILGILTKTGCNFMSNFKAEVVYL